MLKARKYTVSDDLFKCEESYLTHKENDKNDKIYIFFPSGDNKVGVSPVRQYIKDMQANDVKKALIIVKDEITAFAKQKFNTTEGIEIDYFKEDRLLIDITEHELVPKHELLEPDEKRELLEIYNIKEDKLPRILLSDPISKYFGAKKGDVFKITRKSETTGKYVIYRLVV